MHNTGREIVRRAINEEFSRLALNAKKADETRRVCIDQGDVVGAAIQAAKYGTTAGTEEVLAAYAGALNWGSPAYENVYHLVRGIGRSAIGVTVEPVIAAVKASRNRRINLD